MRKKLIGTIIGTMMIVSLMGCGKEANVSKDDIQGSVAETTTEETMEVLKPIESTEEVTTSEDTKPSEGITQVETTKPVETTTPEVTTKPAESVKGTNQLTDEMNEEVEVFKYLDDLSKKTRTETVTVGGKISLALVLPGSTIYSQDTGIAVADGLIITGVSEGTTYVVAESSLGQRMVFCINVKGQSSESGNEEQHIQIGENQLTSEMNEEVEVFKHLDDLSQRTRTETVAVGGKVSIALILSGSTIYSQDTGIAVADGLIITGISKGTTYIVAESPLGLRNVFKIIVE